MTKTTIKTIEINGTTREIVQFTSHGVSTYQVKEGRQYIGKVSDGGYTTQRAAEKRALVW